MTRYWRAILAGIPILAAILAGLACAKATPEELRKFTLTPSLTPIPTDTPTPAPTQTARPGDTPTPSATPWVEKVSALQSVNIRSDPGEGSPARGVLYSGAEVILTGQCSAGWAEIEFGAGRAWILSRYLSGEVCQ